MVLPQSPSFNLCAFLVYGIHANMHTCTCLHVIYIHALYIYMHYMYIMCVQAYTHISIHTYAYLLYIQLLVYSSSYIFLYMHMYICIFAHTIIHVQSEIVLWRVWYFHLLDPFFTSARLYVPPASLTNESFGILSCLFFLFKL